MACTFANDDEKWAFVMQIVRAAIRQVDGLNRRVTQQTVLGPAGLGHLPEKRELYFDAINEGLASNGNSCRLRTLSPQSFRAPALLIVRDVSKLVSDDI